MYYIPQRGGQNRVSTEEIKKRISKKAGHWKILYPGIDDIVRLRTKITVKCLDCGVTRTIGLQSWISPANIDRGCPNCANKARRKDAKLS